MNKETLRMQMLAGVITEGQYKKEMNEVTDFPPMSTSYEDNEMIPFNATSKRYVVDRLNEIFKEYDEDALEELKDAGFFEQDFEEELVVEFGDDYDAVDISPELSDFISNLAY
jgi:hypothetical protein